MDDAQNRITYDAYDLDDLGIRSSVNIFNSDEKPIDTTAPELKNIL